jgi:hypothetical protein
MRKGILLVAFLLLTHHQMHSWGMTGHRAMGLVAEMHLSKKAKKNVQRVLGNESIAIASIWMDDIRSDKSYNYTNTWHWATIPDGQRYEDYEQEATGDVVSAIETVVVKLKQGGLSAKEENELLKFLIHMVGDMHQPLHVGRPGDRGANDVKVKWFGKDSNLHRVWDSEIIESKNLSYTELAHSINHASKAQIKEWQSTGVRDWAHEAMQYREQIYDIPEDGRLGYEYMFHNWATIQLQLLKSGIRLAGLLNDIYG